jgi:hypothetical protein
MSKWTATLKKVAVLDQVLNARFPGPIADSKAEGVPQIGKHV